MASKFIFSYNLTEARKAKGTFCFGKKEFPFEVINVCNPLGDLLKAMLSLVQEPAHLWDEENKTVVEWYSEEYIFMLELTSSDGEYLHISLVKTAAPFGAEIPPVNIKATVAFKEFYLVIITELDGLLKRKGLLNYAQLWEKDEFPLTWFLTLKKYLIHWKIWKASMDEADILESEFMMVLS